MKSGQSLAYLAALPLPFNKLKRLQLTLKDGGISVEGGTGEPSFKCVTTKEPKELSLAERVERDLMRLCQSTAQVVRLDNETLEMIFEGSQKKRVKKIVKKERKALQISINKKAGTDVERGEILRQAIELSMKACLAEKGWRRFLDGKLLLDSEQLSPLQQDGRFLQVMNLTVQLGEKKEIILFLSPESYKWRPLDFMKHIPENLQVKLSEGEKVNLEEWLTYQGEESTSHFRCKVLPDLLEGWVTGVVKLESTAFNRLFIHDKWLQEYGIRLTNDFFLVEVTLANEDRATRLLPSCCVVTAAGSICAPLSVRHKNNNELLQQLFSDVASWNFLGAGCLNFERSDAPCQSQQPQLPTQSAAWTTAKDLIKQGSKPPGVTDKVVPNLMTFGTRTTFYRPKPPSLECKPTVFDAEVMGALISAHTLLQQPVLPQPYKPHGGQAASLVPRFAARKVLMPSASASTQVKNGSSLTAQPKLPSQIAAVLASRDACGGPPARPLVPNFASRKKGVAPGKLPGRLPSKAAKPAAGAVKPPRSKASAAKTLDGGTGETTKKRKVAGGDEGAKGRATSAKPTKKQKGDPPAGKAIDTLPSVDHPDGSAAPPPPSAGGLDAVQEPKSVAGRKRAAAGDFDADENTAWVRAKITEGKAKDVPIPRLKNFINTHKLGKVSGKKEELLERVQTFIRA